MNACQNCRHWERPRPNAPEGICTRVEWDGEGDPPSGRFFAYVSDRAEGIGNLITGPDFGCAMFERKGQPAMNRIEDIVKARGAILEDLKRRYSAGDTSVFPNKPWPNEDQNCFSGSGNIQCPICEDGILTYARSSMNGHVSASCDQGCVSWME